MTRDELIRRVRQLIEGQGFESGEPELEDGMTIVRLRHPETKSALGSVTIYRTWEELTPEGAEGIMKAHVLETCRAVARQLAPK